MTLCAVLECVQPLLKCAPACFFTSSARPYLTGVHYSATLSRWLRVRRTAKSEALAIEVAAKEEAATTKKELEAARARQRAILA